MNESKEPINQPLPVKDETSPGPVSQLLTLKGHENISLKPDHLGIELIAIKPCSILAVAKELKSDGFDYLQCQGGYDEGAGEQLVCFYHLIAMQELLDKNQSEKNISLREVRLKVFLNREGDLEIPSLYNLFKGADWQERETYDMFGIQFKDHPHPKRLLMPEDWKGWPLRKDYVQPDFYEMQDAY